MNANGKLARKLDSIAANETFDMVAILQAQEQCRGAYWAMLQRYRNGSQQGTDHIMLQELANRFRNAK